MTEHKAETRQVPGSRFPEGDPRNQAAAQTPLVEGDPGPGEPGYYNPPDPNFGVSHTASNEVRTEALVKKAEEIPDTRSPWDKKQQGETGKGKHAATTDNVDEENLEEYTVPELRDIADKRGIDVKSDARKDEIIEAIKAG